MSPSADENDEWKVEDKIRAFLGGKDIGVACEASCRNRWLHLLHAAAGLVILQWSFLLLESAVAMEKKESEVMPDAVASLALELEQSLNDVWRAPKGIERDPIQVIRLLGRTMFPEVRVIRASRIPGATARAVDAVRNMKVSRRPPAELGNVQEIVIEFKQKVRVVKWSNFDPAEIAMGSYFARLNRQLSREWRGPAGLNSGNAPVVHCSVYKDGTVKDVVLVKPSSIPNADVRALEFLRSHEPLSPFPEEGPEYVDLELRFGGGVNAMLVSPGVPPDERPKGLLEEFEKSKRAVDDLTKKHAGGDHAGEK
ncbi:MAG TPA: TonB C-terminal domain-containing protein [Candidatus Obscuribacterales bacterium]